MTHLLAIDVDYRKIGDTTVTAATPLLEAKGSPMLASLGVALEAASPVSAQFVAQAGFESQWLTDTSVLRPEDHNAVAMRPWFADPQGHKGPVIGSTSRKPTGEVVTVSPYAVGAVKDAKGGYMLRFASDALCAAEYRRRLLDPAYKNGVYVPAKTLHDFLRIYCPPGDVHPDTGVDNADILPQYEATVNRILLQLAANEANGETTMIAGFDNVAVLITAGHRSVSDPGNQTEKSLTDDVAKADTDAFRKAGIEATWWQRDADGDALPDLTQGGLDEVALGCGRWLAANIKARPKTLFVLLDDHYNGPSSVIHAIVPDNVGLGTAYTQGRDPYDTAANNTLDVTLAKTIAAKLDAHAHRGVHSGILKVPGVMSERETGVAIQYDARLAMFAATAPSRQNAIRLVVEHGGYNDPGMRDFPAMAQAKVAAFREVFGLSEKPPTTPPANPWPYPAPSIITQADGRERVVLANGAVLVKLGGWWEVSNVDGTKRLRYAFPGSESVGPDLPFGKGDASRFESEYLIINPDRSLYLYTEQGTRIAFNDVVPYTV